MKYLNKFTESVYGFSDSIKKSELIMKECLELINTSFIDLIDDGKAKPASYRNNYSIPNAKKYMSVFSINIKLSNIKEYTELDIKDFDADFNKINNEYSSVLNSIEKIKIEYPDTEVTITASNFTSYTLNIKLGPFVY